MAPYLLRRIVQAIPVLFFVSVAVFSMTHMLPGDPVRALVPVGDQTADPATMEKSIQRVRHQYGLDLPVPVQYVRWVGKVLTGDLGTSIATRRGVTETLRRRLPISITLGLLAWVISLTIAVPAGILAATHRGSLLDVGATIVSVASVAIPGFWLGMLLILVFVVWLGWLPPPGSYVPIWQDPVRGLQLTILPALALAGFTTAAIMRLTRSSMLEVLSQDYIRTARAKGLRERHVILSHAIRNASLAVVTVLGLQVIFFFSGSVIIERMFAIPGVGSMALDAIFGRDFPVIQGFVLLVAVTVVVANLVVDVLYGIIDPRIRRAGR
jgi:peptide/nickel transport system permease protein